MPYIECRNDCCGTKNHPSWNGYPVPCESWKAWKNRMNDKTAYDPDTKSQEHTWEFHEEEGFIEGKIQAGENGKLFKRLVSFCILSNGTEKSYLKKGKAPWSLAKVCFLASIF